MASSTVSFVFRVWAAALLLSSCAGGNSMPKAYSAADTVVIQSAGPGCTITFTVHRDDTAQRSSSNCEKAASTTLSSAIASQLFADVQAAAPLGSQPFTLTVDTSLTISWDGQQSPNICGSGQDTIEQALCNDAGSVAQAFPQ